MKPSSDYIRYNNALLFIFLTAVAPFMALAGQCIDVYSHPITELVSDDKMQSVPLKMSAEHNNVYSGYEFMKGPPVFQNPEAVRDYINQNFKGGLVVMAGNPSQKNPIIPPTEDEILNNIKKKVSFEVYAELEPYVKSVLLDFSKRHQFPYRKFIIAIRTERIAAIPLGHAHGAGDIVYSRAEIGPTTQVDKTNQRFFSNTDSFYGARYNKDVIAEADYLFLDSPDSILIFGGIWHRTPPLTPGQKRLVILINFDP